MCDKLKGVRQKSQRFQCSKKYQLLSLGPFCCAVSLCFLLLFICIRALCTGMYQFASLLVLFVVLFILCPSSLSALSVWMLPKSLTVLRPNWQGGFKGHQPLKPLHDSTGFYQVMVNSCNVLGLRTSLAFRWGKERWNEEGQLACPGDQTPREPDIAHRLPLDVQKV